MEEDIKAKVGETRVCEKIKEANIEYKSDEVIIQSIFYFRQNIQSICIMSIVTITKVDKLRVSTLCAVQRFYKHR